MILTQRGRPILGESYVPWSDGDGDRPHLRELWSRALAALSPEPEVLLSLLPPERLREAGWTYISTAEGTDRDIAVTPPALIAELEEALGKATEEVRLVAQIASAASKGQWRASAWLLERKYPERWMARPRPAVEPEPEPADDDAFAELDQIAAQRRKRSGRPVTS
jgi:hypothetical protein